MGICLLVYRHSFYGYGLYIRPNTKPIFDFDLIQPKFNLKDMKMTIMLLEHTCKCYNSPFYVEDFDE